MGSIRIARSLSLAVLAAFAVQGCAPVSSSFPKGSNKGGNTQTGGGASVLNTEEGGQIVLEDSRAAAIIVVGSKEADAVIKNIPESAGKAIELPIHETEALKKDGSYDYPIRGMGNKISAVAVIILDEVSVQASGVSADELKAVKFVWSISMDRKTIELAVSRKVPDAMKAALLPTIRSVVVAVAAAH